jgi:hypothetical protein
LDDDEAVVAANGGARVALTIAASAPICGCNPELAFAPGPEAMPELERRLDHRPRTIRISSMIRATSRFLVA